MAIGLIQLFLAIHVLVNLAKINSGQFFPVFQNRQIILAHFQKLVQQANEQKLSNVSKALDLSVHHEIVNRHDFKYLLNPKYSICGRVSSPLESNRSHEVFLLIYVHSGPENFKRRMSLRETWAKRSFFRDIRLVFMMGKSIDFKTTQKLRLESNIYGDIVQEDFIDSYRNLTYKGIMAMRWISEYCANAKFILKVDDDIVTNLFTLLRHLKSMGKQGLFKQRTVMCLVWTNMAVIRDKSSKWFLSKEEFSADYFGNNF